MNIDNLKLTVVYGFDNEDQISQFKLSLKSILISKNGNYKILVLVSDEFLKEKVQLIFNELKTSSFSEVQIINELSVANREGMFYWLLAPYLVDTEYILQLDNDIIVSSDFDKLIESVEDKKNQSIFGVRINFSETNWAVQTIKQAYGFNVNEETLSKWINAGVVLVNNEKYRKHFISKKNVSSKIVEYSNLFNNKELKNVATSDEAFIINFAWDEMGALKRKYNLRFHSPSTTRKNLPNKDYFFHYNLKFIENGKRNQKLDFEKMLLNKGYSEFVSEALAISISGMNSYDEVSKKYKSYSKYVITKLIENHKELL